MGKREHNILKYINPDYDFKKPAIPKLRDYKNSKWYDEIFAIYKELGGIQNEIPIGIKSNHLDFAINGKILELDEENHFNRYRTITLQAGIYKDSSTLSNTSYLEYCKKFENKCQARGGYWASASTEEQFGKANIPGNLNGNGSSRWKQRAFYDMLKDFIPYITNSEIPIKRISIYDKLSIDGDQIEVNKILSSYNPKYVKEFSSFIDNYVNAV